MRGVICPMSTFGEGFSRMMVCVHVPRRDSIAVRPVRVTSLPVRWILERRLRRRLRVTRNLRNSCFRVVEGKFNDSTDRAGVYLVRKVLRGTSDCWNGILRSISVQS